MKLHEWLESQGMTELKINAKFLEAEFKLRNRDKEAAWEMYIELLTRITTQPLPEGSGDNKTALESVYTLFPLTRDIIKQKGRRCIEFTRIAIVVLNQIIRPFTAKWHRLSLAGEIDKVDKSQEFRKELAELQEKLKVYTKALSDMAGVEDLTELEEE